jgi:DNA gyrase/topoisomerase IV subunit A
MSEKKVVGRNVAIALGIVAIIILVGLVGAIANYTSIINGKDNTITTRNSEIANKNIQISNLQTWLDGNKTLLTQTQTWLTGNLTLINTLNTQITNLQDQISGLNSQISSLNAEIADLENQIINLNTTIEELQSEYNDYMATHGYTNDEYWDLYTNYTHENWWHHYYKNKTEELEAPKLIKVHLMSDDVRHVYPWDPDHHLHVYGYVCNVGTNTAYSSKIHVVAYQSGGVVAIDTYITLGTINGESWTSKDSSIYYSGSELVSWTLTLEWTA